MDDTAVSHQIDTDQAPGLPDVTELALLDLTASGNTVLDAAVRRLLAEMDRPQESFAGFGDCP